MAKEEKDKSKEIKLDDSKAWVLITLDEKGKPMLRTKSQTGDLAYMLKYGDSYLLDIISGRIKFVNQEE